MRMMIVGYYILPLAALSLSFARTAEAATNCGAPGPYQAIVWQNGDFTGNCDVLHIGSYPFSAVNAMSVGNDSVSAVSMGSAVKVTLYENDLPGTGSGGDWLPVITTRTVQWDFNDKTSSIRVEGRTSCPSPGLSQVVVYSDFNFGGHCDVIDLDYPVTYQKILGLSVGNDTISSMMCGSSSAGVLWEHDLGIGSSFMGTKACYLPALTAFNDTASSVVVRPACAYQDDSCPANAYCELPSSGCTTGTLGACLIKPTTCPSNVAPVCGCDGITYLNDCERQAGGVPKQADGYCPN